MQISSKRLDWLRRTSLSMVITSPFSWGEPRLSTSRQPSILHLDYSSNSNSGFLVHSSHRSNLSEIMDQVNDAISDGVALDIMILDRSPPARTHLFVHGVLLEQAAQLRWSHTPPSTPIRLNETLTNQTVRWMRRARHLHSKRGPKGFPNATLDHRLNQNNTREWVQLPVDVLHGYRGITGV